MDGVHQLRVRHSPYTRSGWYYSRLPLIHRFDEHLAGSGPPTRFIGFASPLRAPISTSSSSSSGQDDNALRTPTNDCFLDDVISDLINDYSVDATTVARACSYMRQ